nr:hypothetical protein GCM10020185_88180 [Pseudomonas brassicacearum subsp. brassicacearum]
MAELEKKATGLARGALYYHIGSKEELLFEITSRYLRVLIAEGTPLCESDLAAEDKFRQFSAIVMRTIVTHLAEMTVCFREVYSVIGERQTELLDLHRQYEKALVAHPQDWRERGDLPHIGLVGREGYPWYSSLQLLVDQTRRPTLAGIHRDVFFCDTLLPGLKVEPPLA